MIYETIMILLVIGLVFYIHKLLTINQPGAKNSIPSDIPTPGEWSILPNSASERYRVFSGSDGKFYVEHFFLKDWIRYPSNYDTYENAQKWINQKIIFEIECERVQNLKGTTK